MAILKSIYWNSIISMCLLGCGSEPAPANSGSMCVEEQRCHEFQECYTTGWPSRRECRTREVCFTFCVEDEEELDGTEL